MISVKLERADIKAYDMFYKIKAEDINIKWTGHSSKPDYEELKQWYMKQLSNESRKIYIIKFNNIDVGYLYFDINFTEQTIEISYAVSKYYNGLGIATKAVNYILESSISKKYHNYTFFLYIEKNNFGSIKVAKKNNFYKTNEEKVIKSSNGKEMLMQKYIYKKKKTFIIAEAGVNHNGDINIAKKLIDIAVEAGVDAVKFQTWKTELLVTKETTQAEYQTKNTGIEESQYDMLKKLELSYKEFEELKKYCDDKNIIFMSTPDEFESADFLYNLQNIFKIGSGELTNIPYLRHIGKMNKQIILSTGMGNLGEVEKALATLIEAGTKKENIILLHATTLYPTPMEEVNLNAMLTLKKAFNIDVGYSDHTMGIEVAVAAVALGATVIEKHYTLSKKMEGPDHKASLEPFELKSLVSAIRNTEIALGNGEKLPQTKEKSNRKVVRKSIVAKKNISKGESYTQENLTVKRVGYGISSSLWDEIIGLKAQYDFKTDDIIRL